MEKDYKRVNYAKCKLDVSCPGHCEYRTVITCNKCTDSTLVHIATCCKPSNTKCEYHTTSFLYIKY